MPRPETVFERLIIGGIVWAVIVLLVLPAYLIGKWLFEWLDDK